MGVFLADEKKTRIQAYCKTTPLNQFYWQLFHRVQYRTSSPGLADLTTNVEWWHYVMEYVSEAAMIHALTPTENIGIWLRDVTLSLIRRNEDDWIGPWFRDHEMTPKQGHLETAHLVWAVAIALDLAPDVFSRAERNEIVEHLRTVGCRLCRTWLDRTKRFNNWRSILLAGYAIGASVLNDQAMMHQAVQDWLLCTQLYQPDGSYGESLQYCNYATYGLVLAYEALVGRNPELKEQLSIEQYTRSVTWYAYSYFYTRPLSGWGQYPLPRSANFNDSAAIFRPTSDILLHIAVRGKERFPQEAGLARWLFDTLYMPISGPHPSDRYSFGFVNQFGFLGIPLLPDAPAALSPQQTQLPLLKTFSNGDSIVRNAWAGKTILAVHGGGEPLHAPAHLHGDINSFILVHNQERLLVDPGHSCYRNLMRELDLSSVAHNTCTFTVDSTTEDLRQEDMSKTQLLVQDSSGSRNIIDDQLMPPVDRGARTVLAEQAGPVTVIASEAAKLYGTPVTGFLRFWCLTGPHVLFIVDKIDSSIPVRTTWNWVLNNRDNLLEYKVLTPDRIVARRGNAGMKLFHLSNGRLSGPAYGYVHDAYHPLPNQLGEGKPGSGLIFRWQESQKQTSRFVVHAIALDDYATIADWHLHRDEKQIEFEGPGAGVRWRLAIQESPFILTIEENVSGQRWTVEQKSDGRIDLCQ